MDTPPYFGELLALLSPMAWAVAVILFRKTGEKVPPVPLNLVKNSVAWPLFLLTFYLLGAQAPEQTSANDIVLLLASGILGIAVADGLFFMCLNRLGASRQAVVNTAYSPPIIILSVIFLDERLTLLQVAGVLLILSAVLCIGLESPASKDSSEEAPSKLRAGVLLGVGACVAQAVSVVMIKPFMADWPLIWMMCWRVGGGLLASILILPLLSREHRALDSLAHRRVWLTMLPGILCGTYLSLLLWLGGFKYADASIASALNQTASLFTFILAVLILREPVTRRGLTGLGLGACGVLLVTVLGPPQV